MKLTQESLDYRSEAQTTLTAADILLAELQDKQKREAQAKALQERLRIISSANLARSRMAPKLQIAPVTSMPMIGGTAQFKRRPQSRFNSSASNTLNV